MSPRVTIAIPTYRRAGSFLPEALESARSQTYSNLEILVCDNASPDNTAELVGDVKDSRIRYFRHTQNIGPAGNMNFCVQQARGDYLVVLPDDDLMDPDFVESCVGLAAEQPNLGLYRAGTRVVDGQGSVIREMPNGAVGLSFDDYVMAWLSGTTSPYQCSAMFLTTALQSTGLHSRHYLYDDVIAQFKIAARYGRADLEAIKATFRLHAGELTSKADIAAWCEESRDLLEILCELSPSNAAAIRSQGAQFLAMADYRRAWRQPLPQRLRGCLTVYLMHHFVLPPKGIWTRGLRRRAHDLAARFGGG